MFLFLINIGIFIYPKGMDNATSTALNEIKIRIISVDFFVDTRKMDDIYRKIKTIFVRSKHYF